MTRAVKFNQWFISSFLVFLLLLLSCTEKEEHEPGVHPDDWTNPNSKNSHVTKIYGKLDTTHTDTTIKWSTVIEGCGYCHATKRDNQFEFNGGSSGIPCDQCHEGGPSGHPASGLWVWSSDSSGFHGNKIIALTNHWQKCQICHGEDYKGGIIDTPQGSCYYCHGGGRSGHPADSVWIDLPDDDNFHGKVVAAEGLQRCKICHGDNFSGGISNVNCSSCHAGGPSGHPAYEIWVGSPNDPEFHGNVVRQTGHQQCADCHGNDFQGGISSVSCYTCHAGGPSGHPATNIWVGSPDNDNFHGKVVAEKGNSSCADCHGSDFKGGTSGISCYTCHAGGPSGHPAYNLWVSSPEDDDSHGNVVAENGNSSCTKCHGTDFRGGWSEKSCYTCHAGGPSGHPASEIWVDSPEDENFHGKQVIDIGWERCQLCHGVDYQGGWSGQSCYTCHAGGRSGHPDPTLFITPGTDEYHGKIFWDNIWNFDDCKVCHGEDLNSGGLVPGCQTSSCHTAVDGIFDCNNCHSDGSGSIFYDVRNNSSSSIITVGAHLNHVLGPNYLTEPIDCSECHIVPSAVFESGHLDTTQKVVFSSFVTNSGQLQSTWNHDSGTCSEVYCHHDVEPEWTVVNGTYSDCGSCHSIPPDEGAHTTHVTGLGADCSVCHSGYSSTDELVEMFTHINGEHDVNLNEFYDGSYDSSTESCSGTRCHGVLNTTPDWFTTEELSCTSCHGGLNGELGAPPYDLSGNLENTSPIVGAHETHLNGGEFSDGADCNECHIVPDSVQSTGHFDLALIAEITFGELASDSGAVAPVWDRGTTTCSDIYCHGAFSYAKAESENDWAYAGDYITGNAASGIWNNPNSVVCGVCHELPPNGHGNYTACGSCHSSVVGSDHSTIIDKSKHINGQKNYP